MLRYLEVHAPLLRDIFSDRGSADALALIRSGPRRFEVLEHNLDLQRHHLASCLTRLVGLGLVRRRIASGKAAGIEYEITAKGRSSVHAMHVLERHAGAASPAASSGGVGRITAINPRSTRH